MISEWEKKAIEKVDNGIVVFVVAIVFYFLGYYSGFSVSKHEIIDEVIKADSMIKVNDSIKIKVEQLDSIKDAKIIEVQKLNNDSTVKLFYQLIRN